MLRKEYISDLNFFNFFNFSSYIVSNLTKYLTIININDTKQNINLYLKEFSDLDKIIFFFYKHTLSQYFILTDMFGVDLINSIKRFQVSYCLLSIKFNSRIRINIFVNENSKIKSLTKIFKSSGWLEREIWDLFGIFFYDHADLRRILTDYGFEGFALRKDFPLSGFVEIRYDDSLKRIVYEPLETMQEYRFFDFKSPWEQIENLY